MPTPPAAPTRLGTRFRLKALPKDVHDALRSSGRDELVEVVARSIR